MGEDKDNDTLEMAVAKLLRTYAEKFRRHLPGPGRLDDWSSYDKQFQKIGIKGATDPEMIRLVNLVVRIQIFLLERKGDYEYKADAMKLGDADKILLPLSLLSASPPLLVQAQRQRDLPGRLWRPACRRRDRRSASGG